MVNKAAKQNALRSSVQEAAPAKPAVSAASASSDSKDKHKPAKSFLHTLVQSGKFNPTNNEADQPQKGW